MRLTQYNRRSQYIQCKSCLRKSCEISRGLVDGVSTKGLTAEALVAVFTVVATVAAGTAFTVCAAIAAGAV
jgi:hypothetical protein